eukprot:9089980-Alexandrium_andersonii.AAC.1
MDPTAAAVKMHRVGQRVQHPLHRGHLPGAADVGSQGAHHRGHRRGAPPGDAGHAGAQPGLVRDVGGRP